MQREANEEQKTHAPPPKHPSPFSTPLLAVVLATVVGVSAVYANYARGTLFDALNEDYRVNYFEQVINDSTLKESFSEDEWQYTIIAPTDQAFDKAQWKKEQAASSRNPAQTDSSKQLIYSDISPYDYVTSTPVYPEDIKFGKYIRIPSLSGQDIVFSRIQGGTEGLRINGQQVNSVHYADNGVIYVIDDMIPFPPQQQFSWSR